MMEKQFELDWRVEKQQETWRSVGVNGYSFGPHSWDGVVFKDINEVFAVLKRHAVCLFGVNPCTRIYYELYGAFTKKIDII